MEKKLRIAFAGAASQGKTTLATWLARELNLEYLPEPFDAAVDYCKQHGLYLGRQFFKTWAEWFPYMSKEETINFETGLHYGQAILEGTAVSRGHGYVADSAGVCRSAGALFYCAKDQDEEIVHRLVTFSFNRSMYYDFIFYLPRTLPVVPDGHRDCRVIVADAIDYIIQGLLRRAKSMGTFHGTVIAFLPDETLEQRKVTILDVLKRHDAYTQIRTPDSVPQR